MKQKFALIIDNPSSVKLQEEFEIQILTPDSPKDNQTYIVSNSKDVDAEIIAPEINLYLKNSKTADPEKRGKDIFRMFQARFLFHLYSSELPKTKRIGNKLVVIGDDELFEKINQFDRDDVLDITGPIPPESIKSIDGVIGELVVNTDSVEGVETDQIVWQDRPNEFDRVGVWDINNRNFDDVANYVIENAKYGYEYEKVLKYDSSICQRYKRIVDVCGYCADVCPVDAILKIEEDKQLKFVDINCTRCGGCVSICPAGALDYRVPDRSVFHMMSKLYKERIPLIIPEPMLDEKISFEMKEDILPMVVGGKKFLDESHLLTILQESGSQVVIYNDYLSKGTSEAIDLINEIYEKRYGKKGVFVASNIEELNETIKHMDFIDGSYNPIEIDTYVKKREIFAQRLSFIVNEKDLGEVHTKEHIHYALINVDASKCTLCLSCAQACNVEALKPFEQDNSLRLNPSICTACGYCIEVCPEDCMSMTEDVIYLDKSWFEYRTLAKDELFKCIVCGKPFAPAKSIERIAKQMKAIWPEDDPRIKTLYCCPDCKPKVMMGDKRALEKISMKGKIL